LSRPGLSPSRANWISNSSSSLVTGFSHTEQGAPTPGPPSQVRSAVRLGSLPQSLSVRGDASGLEQSSPTSPQPPPAASARPSPAGGPRSGPGGSCRSRSWCGSATIAPAMLSRAQEARVRIHGRPAPLCIANLALTAGRGPVASVRRRAALESLWRLAPLDLPVNSPTLEREVDGPGVVGRAHPACYVIWREESAALRQPPPRRWSTTSLPRGW
jgi:hypothetical protein